MVYALLLLCRAVYEVLVVTVVNDEGRKVQTILGASKAGFGDLRGAEGLSEDPLIV